MTPAARFWWGCVIVGSATMLDGLVLASAGAGLGVAGALVTCAGMLIIQQRERKNP